MGTKRAHPFRELRHRPEIEFRIHHIADEAGGAAYARLGDRAVIVISPRLSQVDREEALGHELEHDEIRVVSPPATPATMQRIEHMVHRRVTDWLLPRDELEAFVRARSSFGEGVDVAMVAEHFGRSEDLAERALSALLEHLGEMERREAARGLPDRAT